MINVVLYTPEIPQNTGNIMRTCIATGATLHLIEPLGFSLDEKHLRRSALDYFPKLTYHVYPDWETFLASNQGDFFFLTRYGHQVYTDIDYKAIEQDIYIVFGKESTGIPKSLLKKHAERCFRIPTTDDVRSLNVANCVAIVLYEILRQSDFPGLIKHEPEKHKGPDFLKNTDLD